MSLTKKRKDAAAKVDKNKFYSLKEASQLVKEINCTKFDSSVDLHIRLGVDPKKSRPTSSWYCFFTAWYWSYKKSIGTLYSR